jgi:hypothetical protein
VNLPLSRRADAAITDPTVDSTPLHCQRFARECVQSALGDAYDSLLCQPSAKLAALAFEHDGSHVVQGDPEPGDLLYLTEGHGGFGHVGIMTESGDVAENSVVHSGPNGAKGFRSLAEFGDPDVIVRLPDWRVISDGGLDLRATYDSRADQVLVAAAELARALGEPAPGWDGTQVTVNGVAVGRPAMLVNGHAWVPVRSLSAPYGLVVIGVSTNERWVKLGR